MSNYDVKYNVQVNTGNSVDVLRAFEQAVAPLATAAKTLESISKSLNTLKNASNKMKPINIQVTIAKDVEAKLDSLLAKIRQIRRESRTMVAGGRVSGAGAVAATSSAPRTYVAPVRRPSMGAIGYKTLGPTPIDVNGVAAIDFLKGMGIAYGIAGAGQLVSSIIKNATEYDNLIQSTRNILQTHDKKGNFQQRFAEMEAVIRDVGVQTKFTAPEVADASKFLAMAGLDLEAIKTSIRPIADIALVGDTQLGETADVVTNIMTAYRKKPEQMRNVADVMTMTFTKSNTTLMEMAEAYKYSAALLSAGGVSFEESAGALGVLGDAGIKGSQAGTTMRTIMANIVNPTKKQLSNWDRIGVKRFDENGQMRDLRSIFEDLSNADLSVADFYKLFHKTAAQGAVSLANSVDKWNEIVADNFLSDGLSKQLADKKKNTLQGLWAQLTSAFTEDGMKGFGGIQETIKSALRKGIEWLKSNEALRLFQEGARNFMEFGGMMMDSLRQIFAIFQKFGPFIKQYFKFQLWLYPILAIVRALKSLMQFGKMLWMMPRGLASGIMGMGFPQAMLAGAGGYLGPIAAAANGGVIAQSVSSRRNLTLAPYYTKGAKIALNPFIYSWQHRPTKNSVSTALAGGILPYSRSMATQAGLAARAQAPAFLSRDERTALWNKHVKRYRQDNWNFMRQNLSSADFKNWQKGKMAPWEMRQIRAQFEAERNQINDAVRDKKRQMGKLGAQKYAWQRGAAGALGAAAGIGMGAMIASANDWSSGGILMGGLTAAASMAALGGPVGWIAGGATAVGTLAAAWYKAGEETRNAEARIQDYIRTTKVCQGLYYGEGANTAMKTLAAFYNKQSDLNDLMAERIKILRETAGLMSGVNTSGTNISTEPAKKILVDLDGADKFLSSIGMASQAVDLVNSKKIPGLKMDLNGDNPMWYDSKKGWVSLHNPKGWDDNYDVAAMQAALIEAAFNSSESQEIAEHYTTQLQKALYSGADLSAILDLKKEYQSNYGDVALFGGETKDENGQTVRVPGRVDPTTYPWVWNYSRSAFDKWGGEKYATSYAHLITLHNTYDPIFGADAPVWKAAETFHKHNKNGTLVEKDVVDYLSYMDPQIGMFLQSYTVGKIEDWVNRLIDPTTGKFREIKSKDEKGNPTSTSPQQVAEAFAIVYKKLAAVSSMLGGEAMKQLAPLMAAFDILNDVANAATYDAAAHGKPKVQQYKDGQVIKLASGVGYMRSKGKWHPIAAAAGSVMGKNNIPLTLNDDQMAAAQAEQALTSEEEQYNPGYNPGSDPGYKNPYKSTAGAPKQIIINMESLMNVESIDLTKEDNREVVANVKSQLAQALVEVVHDFAISSGNMV